MNWWISVLVNLLTFQTFRNDNGSIAYLYWRSLDTFIIQTALNLGSWFPGKSLELLPPGVRYLVKNARNSISAGVQTVNETHKSSGLENSK